MSGVLSRPFGYDLVRLSEAVEKGVKHPVVERMVAELDRLTTSRATTSTSSNLRRRSNLAGEISLRGTERLTQQTPRFRCLNIGVFYRLAVIGFWLVLAIVGTTGSIFLYDMATADGSPTAQQPSELQQIGTMLQQILQDQQRQRERITELGQQVQGTGQALQGTQQTTEQVIQQVVAQVQQGFQQEQQQHQEQIQQIAQAVQGMQGQVGQLPTAATEQIQQIGQAVQAMQGQMQGQLQDQMQQQQVGATQFQQLGDAISQLQTQVQHLGNASNVTNATGGPGSGGPHGGGGVPGGSTPQPPQGPPYGAGQQNPGGSPPAAPPPVFQFGGAQQQAGVNAFGMQQAINPAVAYAIQQGGVDGRSLGKPTNFDPSNSKTSFQDWTDSIITLCDSSMPGIYECLEWIVTTQPRVTLDLPMMRAKFPHVDASLMAYAESNIYGILSSYTGGEARSLAEGSFDEDHKPARGHWVGQAGTWENRIVDYEVRPGAEKVSDAMRMAALVHMCPNKLREHLQLNAGRFTNYVDLREEVFSYLDQVAPAAQTTMDVGSIDKSKGCFVCGGPHLARDCPKAGEKGKGKGSKGKSGGKGGGKSKGKGKSGGKDGKGQKGKKGGGKGACSNCGKMGHSYEQCWSKPKALNAVDPKLAQMQSAYAKAALEDYKRISGNGAASSHQGPGVPQPPTTPMSPVSPISPQSPPQPASAASVGSLVIRSLCALSRRMADVASTIFDNSMPAMVRTRVRPIVARAGEVLATMDSGAAASVCPPSMFGQCEQIQPEVGLNFQSADGSLVPELYKVRPLVMTEEGLVRQTQFSVASVNKVLMRELFAVSPLNLQANDERPEGIQGEEAEDDGYEPSTPLGADDAERGDFELGDAAEVQAAIDSGQLHAEFEEEPMKMGQRTPYRPSAEEVRQHNISHVPYRDWCVHCVRGRGRTMAHHRSAEDAEQRERRRPTVSMDYFYLGSRAEETLPLLAVLDESTQRMFSVTMPSKGTEHQYCAAVLVKLFRCLGLQHAIVKSDTERSLVALRKALQDKFPGLGCEDAVKGESASNGAIESCVGRLQGQVRTLKSSLEDHYKIKLHPKHPILCWMVDYAGTLISRFLRGPDGRTPYERSVGKKWRIALPEFGECVHYQPLKGERETKKMEAKFELGIYLGIQEGTAMRWVGTADGVVRVWTIKTLPEEDKWQLKMLEEMIGVPWQLRPRVQAESNVPQLPVEIELAPRDEKLDDAPAQEVKKKSYVPRGLYVRKDVELKQFGFTEGCDGCERAKHGLSHRQHSAACKKRIMEELGKTEIGRARLEKLKEKEEQYIVAVQKREEDEKKRAREQDAGAEERAAKQAALEEEMDRILSPDAIAAIPDSQGGPFNSSEALVPQGIAPASAPSNQDDSGAIVIDDERDEPMVGSGGDGGPPAMDIGSLHQVSRDESFVAAVREASLAGLAFDLTTHDDEGRPWDFCKKDCRDRAEEMIDMCNPDLLIGCPPCGPFSVLPNLNEGKCEPGVLEEKRAEGEEHLQFCCRQYRRRMARNRYFLHEHPGRATSWKSRCMEELAAEEGVHRVDGDLCEQGLEIQDDQGTWGFAKKRTGFLTNSECKADELNVKCSNEPDAIQIWRETCYEPKFGQLPGRRGPKWGDVVRRVTLDVTNGRVLQDLHDACNADKHNVKFKIPDGCVRVETLFYYKVPGKSWHRHIPLIGGKAKQCEVYPDGLIRSILKGLRKQLKKDIPINSMDFGPTNQEVDVDLTLAPEDWTLYTDEVSGKRLESGLVQKARAEEIEYARRYKVWEVVPTSEAWSETNRPPISSRWIDINKGDEQRPQYRSRLVIQEIRHSDVEAIFAATPPLESVRMLLSLQRTGRDRDLKGRRRKVMFIDIRRAHWTAKIFRKVYVALPMEAGLPEGTCGRLLKAMYGCRDAAACWELEITDCFTCNGFAPGLGSPVLFVNQTRDLKVSIHGDDITVLGFEDDLMWLKGKLEERYELKFGGLLGPDPTDVQDVALLNRLIHYGEDCTTIESDPRHAQIIINELGLVSAKTVSSPGVSVKDADDSALSVEDCKRYRGLVMRCNYLALDRPDLCYAAKELARAMQSPTRSSWNGLKRMGRYLAGKPRLIWKYYDQEEQSSLRIHTDSDDAGCSSSRKSTSCGALYHGRHLLKFYSSTQHVISLSSGESEFYAGIKAGSTLLGGLATMMDLGCSLEGILVFDATAAKAMMGRRGHGKAKHIARCYLWLQQKVHDGEIKLEKIGTKLNTADLGTKHLDGTRIEELVAQMNLALEGGKHHLALEVFLLLLLDAAYFDLPDASGELRLRVPSVIPPLPPDPQQELIEVTSKAGSPELTKEWIRDQILVPKSMVENRSTRSSKLKPTKPRPERHGHGDLSSGRCAGEPGDRCSQKQEPWPESRIWQLRGVFRVQSQLREEIAENARWLLHETSWGYLTSSSNKVPFTDTFSFSDGAAENSTGRIFFYVMGGFSDAFPEGMPAALTVSEAEIDSSRCNRKSPSLDPEDPRCAKLTLSGCSALGARLPWRMAAFGHWKKMFKNPRVDD
eukprot:s663_g22.t1